VPVQQEVSTSYLVVTSVVSMSTKELLKLPVSAECCLPDTWPWLFGFCSQYV